MRDKPAGSPDLLISRIAAAQHGVITTAQCRGAGLSPDAITRRIQAGRLHPTFRGVYAVGHPNLSSKGRWMAAVKACGDLAVLSHRSAAELWRMLQPREGPVDVVVPGNSGRRRRDGIRLHRFTTLTRQQSTRRFKIPVTTPARTLEDLARCASPDELSRARRQAEFLGYRTGLRPTEPVDLTRSELERRFLRLCRRHHLPSPEVNVPLLGYEVDFLWAFAKLVVEADGYAGHSGRESFERDRERAAKLAAGGYDIMRFSWRQVCERPREVVAALRSRLAPVLPSRGSCAAPAEGASHGS